MVPSPSPAATGRSPVPPRVDRSAAASTIAPMQLMRLGSTGPAVRDVQRRLADLCMLAHGADTSGELGSATEAAIRVFQQQRGLTADGIVGEDTWRSLVEAGYQLGDRLLYHTRPMLRGDDVRSLQSRLNRLGFDAGYVDGIFGPDTADAVRDFQLNTGHAVDGIAGSRSVDALVRVHRQHQEAPAFAVKEREALRHRARPTVAGARIMIDAAHGPDSPGLTAPDGTPEHEVNWAIANRVAGRLGALGAHVVLARGPRTTPSVSERARLANDEEVEAILSIHMNGLASPDASGAAAYYFGTDGYVSEPGRQLAQIAVDQVVAETGTQNCRTHPSVANILRESRAPAVIIEPGFLTHPVEGRRLITPHYQGTVADALVAVMITFLTGARELPAISA